MAKMSCFARLLGGGRKASSKGKSKAAYAKKANDCPKVKPVEFMDMAGAVDVTEGAGDATPRDTNVVVRATAGLARLGRDEDGDRGAVKKDPPSDAAPVAGGGSSGYSSDGTGENAMDSAARAAGSGSGSSAVRMSPKLKRSCSNIETARCAPEVFGFDLPSKSRSYGELKTLPPVGRPTTPVGAPDASPAASVHTSCSADRVTLKKRSSCGHVLPSRSRKLWWRLVLWSDRDLPRPTMPALPSAGAGGAPLQHDTSDTLAGTKNKQAAVDEDPVQNRWGASPAEASPLDRVGAWLNSLGNASFHVVHDEGVAEHDGGAGRPRCSEIVELPTAGKRQAQAKRRTAQEAVQPSNTFSAAAHMSGMGLKAVPMMAAFSSLRAVNLSGNFIVHISSGSLPKGLHSLDLSRNQIAVIEGLRELTRLRVLNLSYNRISRIGHGLSSCTAIRELYLAGNKISDVEGLHRLLKLAVLDVSSNRVTTAKSLGQLVANYGSLRALNLAGNPVQANVGDDTLRRAVTGLLPRLEYLNKQAVRPQRAREAARDSVAQAALGNGAGAGGWSSRRRPPRRVVSQSPGSSAKRRGREREGSSSRRGTRSRSKTRAQSSTSFARR